MRKVGYYFDFMQVNAIAAMPQAPWPVFSFLL